MYNRWADKANNYNEINLSDSFDKFFTLFVAYNILYTETTKIWSGNLNSDTFFLIPKQPFHFVT
jgi:hypothetical protein